MPRTGRKHSATGIYHVMLHKPHPGNIIKGYAMQQVYHELKEAGLINKEE